jgi:ubiquinone/menaquinone biosynthesis C-methylase UbiE
MSERQRKIYQTDSDRYEALISREDYQGNIPRALDEIVNVDDLDVIDLGAGTGRLAVMLAPRVKSIHAFDASAEMLRVCREKLMSSELSNWQVDVADHRSLPIEGQTSDLVVSGWSVAYLYVWYPETWRAELENWLSEMKRVLRPGGFIVLFESLTTGSETPVRLEHLKDYYPWLDETGFHSRWIRTDLKYESIDEAVELSGFFFGEEFGEKVRQNNWVILPECTGVWWLKV